MATFTNQASLTYNGLTATSNIVTGELLETLSITKEALNMQYNADGSLTYAVNLINSGTTALTGLTLTDDLGAYQIGGVSRAPLRYAAGTARYFVNGVLQTAPTVTAGPPLTIAGISVPAGGNAAILYEALPTAYAPLTAGSRIVNTAQASGAALPGAITATSTVNVGTEPVLSISKAVSPTTVSPNGQLTYTFVIENTGNTAADASDLVAVTDVFTPILIDLTVTFNGAAWTPTTNYTYNVATGAFATVPGQITVPAATYTQSTATGEWIVTPGVSTLTVTGFVA